MFLIFILEDEVQGSLAYPLREEGVRAGKAKYAKPDHCAEREAG
jgi:hypothetical protein